MPKGVPTRNIVGLAEELECGHLHHIKARALPRARRPCVECSLPPGAPKPPSEAELVAIEKMTRQYERLSRTLDLFERVLREQGVPIPAQEEKKPDEQAQEVP